MARLIESTDCWDLVQRSFSAEDNRKIEGLFTIGSGYLHIRGSIEEHFHNCPQNIEYMRMPANVTAEEFKKPTAKWGTYIPGIYGKHPYLNNEMINLPWFLGIAPIIDGERFDLTASTYSDLKRWLDLRTGTIRRSLSWRTTSGVSAQLHFESFADANLTDQVCQRLSIAVDKSCTAIIQIAIDGDIRTNGFDHLRSLAFSGESARELSCDITTDGGDSVRVVSRLYGEGEWTVTSGSNSPKEIRAITGELKLSLAAGTTTDFEKCTLVSSSRDQQKLSPSNERQRLADFSFDTSKTTHDQTWAMRWESSDVVIEGDDHAQLAVRAAIYHLLRCHVPGDCRVAIDAKGYAGEGYFGRFFWDTEMYLLPFFAYTEPSKARDLVNFRIASLEGAKRNATASGYAGARYAWESDSNGDECCAMWQYRDHEIHISADVVYAFKHYAAAANDPKFITQDARETVLEIARYWSERVTVTSDGSVSLLGVMGPDEYAPITNNNGYTNRLVRFALETAATLLSDDESLRKHYRCLARRLDAPRTEEGLYLQCDGFDRLAPPAFEQRWKNRAKPYASNVPQELLYRSQNLKQADTLMMMFLFSEEFSERELQMAFDYYLPRTTHDSSLSCAIHAILAARMGDPNSALELFKRGAFIDLDLQGDGAAEGIHIANCGGNWMVPLYGFLGFRSALSNGPLSLAPILPSGWSKISYKISWKGSRLAISATYASTSVHNLSAETVAISCYGTQYAISGGQKLEIANESAKANRVAAVIFDLDGVITDTAELHYQAWLRLAQERGWRFDRDFNERLKGVSRLDSLRLILNHNAVAISEGDLNALTDLKNGYYLDGLKSLSMKDVLPGIQALLESLRNAGIKTAIASASRNAPEVLERIGMAMYFDYVVDAGSVKSGKPAPDLFLAASEKLGVPPSRCVGIEDATVGIKSIKAAGMYAIAVGSGDVVTFADTAVSTTTQLTVDFIKRSAESLCW